MNDIDKLDGMIKIKGKCGYEFIGGCKELRKYKQAFEKIRTLLASKLKQMKSIDTRSIWFVRLTGEIDILKFILEDNEDENS